MRQVILTARDAAYIACSAERVRSIDKVATSGYRFLMKTKAVEIEQLRDNLSAYLREVRAGTRILVLDRDGVVAEIHGPREAYATPRSSRAEELIEQAKLIPPRREFVECPVSPIKLLAGSATAYLDADRFDARIIDNL